MKSLGNKYLFGAVDETNQFGWLKPVVVRKEMSKFLDQIKHQNIKTYGIRLKYLRCNNAGKNVVPLRKLFWNMELISNLVHPIPQHKGVMERQFAVVVNHANARMIALGIDKLTRSVDLCQSHHTCDHIISAQY
jgi:hypothetical protein